MTTEEQLAEIRARYLAGEYLTWEDAEWLLELVEELEDRLEQDGEMLMGEDI